LVAAIRRLTCLTERVELVEQQHPGTLPHEIKDAMKVGCRLPQIAGDHRIDAHHQKRQPDLLCQRLCGTRLPASGGPVQQDALAPRDAAAIKLVPAPVLVGQCPKLIDQGAIEHEVVKRPLGTADLRERPLALAVAGWLGKEHVGRQGGRRSAARQQRAQIASEGRVVLGLLLFDDLLRGSSKRQLVALAIGPKEFFEFATSHARMLPMLAAGEPADGTPRPVDSAAGVQGPLLALPL
jgi:hypothetical protein